MLPEPAREPVHRTQMMVLIQLELEPVRQIQKTLMLLQLVREPVHRTQRMVLIQLEQEQMRQTQMSLKQLERMNQTQYLKKRERKCSIQIQKREFAWELETLTQMKMWKNWTGLTLMPPQSQILLGRNFGLMHQNQMQEQVRRQLRIQKLVLMYLSLQS